MSTFVTIFKAKWLPEGSVDLAPIPMKGEREIRDIELKAADVTAVFTQYQFLDMVNACMAAGKVLGARGASEAKAVWDDFIVAKFKDNGRFLKMFIWDEKDFGANVLALKARYLNQLGCIDDAEGEAKLKEFAKNLEEKAKAVKPEAVKALNSLPLLAFYWRLRASGVKDIITPMGPVKLPWKANSDDDKAAVMDALSEVIAVEDLRQLEKPSDRPVDDEELKPQTAADVEGKSETASTASTTSKPSSAPSSTGTTESNPPLPM